MSSCSCNMPWFLSKAYNLAKQEADNILQLNKASHFDRLALLYYYRAEESWENYYELKALLSFLSNERHMKNDIYMSGMKKVFYQSELDNCVDFYSINLPENYSASYKYPLIITMSTWRYNKESANIGKYDKEPIIAADVSGRGTGMGSYVTEATFLEVLAHIKATFNIDDERIYLTGFSTGATAAWAVA